jgi:hypothetical protein
MAGAVVQLARADDPTRALSTEADSTGAFRLDSVAPGRYIAGFLHPTLDLLGLEFRPIGVEVAAGDDVRADLALPPLARLRAALCGQAAPAADSTGVLAGYVRDAESGEGVPGATVVLTWTDLTVGSGGVRTERRRIPITTGPSGAFVACGVPPGEGVAISGAAPGRTSGVVEVDVPARGMLLRDVALGDTATAAAAVATPGTPADTPASGGAATPRADSTGARVARGTARLTGTVRDPRGRPLRGARAFVWGTAAGTATNENGTFVLDALPSGTRTLEVRALGFEPRRVAVDLSGRRPATVEVRMAAPVTTLDRVTVVGKPSRNVRVLSEFLDRKRTNPFGRFVTAADIERSAPLRLTDALRMTPGLRVVPGPRFGNVLYGRGNCTPAVFLDGVPMREGASELDMFVSPQQVAGIEVYAGMGGIPPQYAGMQSNACGVVLVWSKR